MEGISQMRRQEEVRQKRDENAGKTESCTDDDDETKAVAQNITPLAFVTLSCRVN